MFQDWEYIPSGLIGESWLSDNIFEIIEAIGDMDDTKKEAFEVWLNHESYDLSSKDIDDLITSFEDNFQGGAIRLFIIYRRGKHLHERQVL